MKDILIAYPIFILGFVVAEGIYLIRNPRTFRAPAVFVYLGFLGLSVIFGLNRSTWNLVPFTLAVGVSAYYGVKMWCHKRHRLKYQREWDRKKRKPGPII